MPAGRPDLLTPERHKVIVDAFNGGAVDSIASDIAGVSNKTIPRWVQKGQEHLDQGIDSKFSKFCLEVKKAKGRTDLKRMKTIDFAADEGNWQAAARVLEATRSSEFSRKPQKTFTIEGESHQERVECLIQLVSDGMLSVDDATKLAGVMQKEQELSQSSEIKEDIRKLEELINSKLHGGIQNGCSENEHDGKS